MRCALPFAVLVLGCAPEPSQRPCSVAKDGDDAVITCPDGSTATVEGGSDGADGAGGVSCTIRDREDGQKEVACEDGTSAVIPGTGPVVCRGAFNGSQAADLESLRGCTTIQGSLRFGPVGGTVVQSFEPLSTLESVSGDVSFVDAEILDPAGLEALTSVGSLLVNLLTGPTDLAWLSALRTLGNSPVNGCPQLAVVNNAELEHLELNGLQTLGVPPVPDYCTPTTNFVENPLLPQCEVDELVARLGGDCGEGGIHCAGNGPGTCP